MRAKECLSCDRFMPSATDCSHSEPSVSHVATGPIVLRRDSNPHHPKRASYRVEDEAMLRIRCWRSGSVRLLRCRPAPRPSFHSAPIWQRAGGGVDIIFRKNMSGSGRCNGYGSQLWREPTVASFPFRQTFEPDRVALTPLLPLVLSPGFEPGLDSSLDCCLYRLGYESMCGYHPCEVAISAQSTIDPATRAGFLHSCSRWTRILRHEA